MKESVHVEKVSTKKIDTYYVNVGERNYNVTVEYRDGKFVRLLVDDNEVLLNATEARAIFEVLKIVLAEENPAKFVGLVVDDNEVLLNVTEARAVFEVLKIVLACS